MSAATSAVQVEAPVQVPSPVVRTVVGELPKASKAWCAFDADAVRPFEYSTNAQAIAARFVDSSDVAPLPAERHGAVVMVREWMELPIPSTAQSIHVDTLRAFLGDPEWDTETTTIDPACDECKGTGTVEHDCDCHMCEMAEEECPDCEGKSEPGLVEKTIRKNAAVRPCWVLGLPFNANLIACTLAVAKAEGAATMWRDGPRDPLFIAGEGWRAIVMPVSEHEGTLPYFETAPRLGVELAK